MDKHDLEYFKSLNYRMEITFDEEENRYYAKFPELGDCMADGYSYQEALEKALEVKDEWLEVTHESGRSIPLPRAEIEQSGRFLVRIPKSLHRTLVQEAQREGVSLNRLVIQILSEDMERRRMRKSVRVQVQDMAQTLKNAFHIISSVRPVEKKRRSFDLTVQRSGMIIGTIPSHVTPEPLTDVDVDMPIYFQPGKGVISFTYKPEEEEKEEGDEYL